MNRKTTGTEHLYYLYFVPAVLRLVNSVGGRFLIGQDTADDDAVSRHDDIIASTPG